MSRQQGTFNLSGNLEPLFDAPLDARLVVPTKSDLYAFQYYYQGMIVSVKSDDTAYLLVGNDPSQESSWKELGSTGGNEVSGSGWGIAKVGTVTGTFDGNGWLQGATVDISGLGVASVDDYEVVLRGASAGSAQIIPYVDSKTTAMFRVGANISTTGVSEFTVGYIIVAKGFGGGVNSSSWGIAKYGTVNITELTSTAYRSAPVDLSDLTIASVDDYVILTQPSSADNISYNIESTWCRKESTTQAFVYAYSSSKDSCSVDYVVIAKGYGGGNGATASVDQTYDASSQNAQSGTAVAEAIAGLSLDNPKMSVTKMGNNRMFDISQSTGGTPSMRDKRLQLEIIPDEEKVRCEMMLQGELIGTKRFLPTVEYINEAISQNVATKTELYTLQNTWRGMIVYVIDEDKYYKLVNDLPAYEASWVEYGVDQNIIEMTESEIDALFV